MDTHIHISQWRCHLCWFRSCEHRITLSHTCSQGNSHRIVCNRWWASWTRSSSVTDSSIRYVSFIALFFSVRHECCNWFKSNWLITCAFVLSDWGPTTEIDPLLLLANQSLSLPTQWFVKKKYCVENFNLIDFDHKLSKVRNGSFIEQLDSSKSLVNTHFGWVV